MNSGVGKRLPEVKTLYEMLPKGAEGGKEFARIVDLLLFHEARRSGRNVTIFSDMAGDYHGLDSFERDIYRQEGTTGYQYKFYPSPLSAQHRQSIVQSLKKTDEAQEQIKHKLRKWILVTPQDLTESATRKDGGDVTWFYNLRDELGLEFELEHWGHRKLLLLFLETRALCLFYYPELIDNGATHKKTIEDTRKRYDNNLPILYRDIQFVGMSVYKQEATKGVPMEHIYIPLSVIPEVQNEQDTNVAYTNPLTFLSQGSRHVILGDPGSGKSTLLRFLALAGISKPLQKRYNARFDKRLPILITLRRYADELKSRLNLSLIDYIQESIQADFTLKDADLDFFGYYLETGQTLLFFDGLDELPSSHFKEIIRNRIRTLITTYPGNTTIVTSRIVGYENPFRFDEKEFGHYRVAKLRLPEIEQFVKDWYHVRIENEREREANVNDLIRILNDKDYVAIRELAENPLLLTIVALVHRIDAVLPDERVVLYQKCTETLLNTWHTWKFRDPEIKNRGKVERRNRHRIEAIANWMHRQSGGTGKTERAVVPYNDLKKFLIKHITDVEKSSDPDKDPEDLADEFLEFIKKRAGLLIELGDNQYSFVHLTFQEYLTSSYIITMGEKDGVSGIWETIKDHCNDPRWHEIIRLIIAGLKNGESQQYLIDQILLIKEIDQHAIKSRLLGGLLLDGIEAAEAHHEEIIKSLIHSGSQAPNVEQLRFITSLLQALIIKESIGETIIYSVFQSSWEAMIDEKQKIGLALIAFVVGISQTNFVELIQDILIKETRDADLINFFLSIESKVEKFESVVQDVEFLWTIQDFLLLTSASGNIVTAIMQAATSSLEPYATAKRAFQEQLICLSLGPSVGPFSHFTANSLIIAFSNPFPDLTRINDRFETRRLAPVLDRALNMSADEGRARALKKELDRALNQKLDRDRALNQKLDRDRDPNQKLDRILDRVRYRVQSQTRTRGPDQVLDLVLDLARDGRENLDMPEEIRLNRILSLDWVLALVQNRAQSWLQDLDLNTKEDFWQDIITTSSFYTPILDILCETFNLKPRAHWWEALRVGFLPTVPERINLFDQDVWRQVEDAFVHGIAGETEVYSAAWQLLFDAWLYIFGYYDSQEEIIFGRLADLTRTVDAAPLRIAHCIRDLAYGDESCANLLLAMIDSEDPEYRSIFEACYWRSTPEEEAKQPEQTKSQSKSKASRKK